MNPNNYASLEASKRLSGAGIVLETDWYWLRVYIRETSSLEWRIVSNASVTGLKGKNSETIPAPTMAEIWRELRKSGRGNLFFAQALEADEVGVWMEWVAFDGFGDGSEIFKNINPTDALIDLLIWVKGEGGATMTQPAEDYAINSGFPIINKLLSKYAGQKCDNCDKRRSMRCPDRKQNNRVPNDDSWCPAYKRKED